MDCSCRYEPVSERRRTMRRDDKERREMIRFETKEPRRQSGDRRKRNAAWDKR